MIQLKLFFSWQSDLPALRASIRKALQNACKSIKKQGKFDIVYDEATRNLSGSPVIETAIKKKIAECDLFVSDCTPICNVGNKYMPNSNVMLELGMAKALMPEAVILILVHKGEWKTEQLPFDFNHQRVSPFYEICPTDIQDYVLAMAESAAQNPRIKSYFDEHVERLFWDGNVKKNIRSGKYLPNVYIENRTIKQHLRDFVDPVVFCKRLIDKATATSYDPEIRRRQIWGKVPFVFDVKPYNQCYEFSDFPSFYEHVGQFQTYLRSKYQELNKKDESDFLDFSKSGRLLEHANFILSRLLLLTSSAGQGKTNLVCDLVQNVLMKRLVPFVYLNGYEINANNIGGAFANVLIPESGKAFSDVLKEIEIYCQHRHLPFIIIIDGLNEK